MWSQLKNTDVKPDLRVGSQRRLSFQCSCCEQQFDAIIQNMYYSSGKCKHHAFRTCGQKRECYTGNVPRPLLRPIRAGLLQNIGTDALTALIATLEPVVSDSAGTADPAVAAMAAARAHIESILTGNYTRVQLLDSIFWGDDTVTRKDGRRYVHPPRPVAAAPSGDAAGTTDGTAAAAAIAVAPAPRGRKRARVDGGPVAAPLVPPGPPMPLIVRDFRSPPWGPIWPGPDKHQKKRISAMLNCDDKFIPLAAIIRGDPVPVWPAVAQAILGLPFPLRPWRIDPQHREWYVDTFDEFLVQCQRDPGTRRPHDLAMQMRFLQAAPESLECIIAGFEAAYVSQAPPQRPIKLAAPADWPIKQRCAAMDRCKRAFLNGNNSFVYRIGDQLDQHWVIVAQLLLGIPIPIGSWRLSPSHIKHCYEVLECLSGHPYYVEHSYAFKNMKNIHNYISSLCCHDHREIVRYLKSLEMR